MAVESSDTHLPKKLGIKDASRVLVEHSERNANVALLDTAPEDEFDVAIAFCLTADDVSNAIARLEPRMETRAGLWLAWPKKASGVPTECSDCVVRDIGLASGLVDNEVCAIDETWSALRFVRRLRDR